MWWGAKLVVHLRLLKARGEAGCELPGLALRLRGSENARRQLLMLSTDTAPGFRFLEPNWSGAEGQADRRRPLLLHQGSGLLLGWRLLGLDNCVLLQWPLVPPGGGAPVGPPLPRLGAAHLLLCFHLR